MTRHRALLFAALLLVTLAAYQPAWHGGMLWDDDAHLTAPALQSWEGLRRIWFEIGTTQQYYPVTHSAFWIQHALWGDRTLGYHLVNIGLHATCAWLIGLLLVRLKVSGAWLAAFIFAVHPVHAETVAWMTELKNTLSGALGLGAMVLLLSGRYRPALALFAFALLSKTTVAVLPAAVLVIVWWQRGTIEWRRDVRPLVPFLALGMAGGIVTAWVERTQIIGVAQAVSALGPIERVLVASRAMWFYLATLMWPADLAFIYPRWTIDARVWWQWVYPAGVVAAAVLCWMLAEQRRRAPMAVLLLFAGLLFPALGFVDVYPFRFSFVADHFQYLASIAMIAAFAAVGRSGRPWRNHPIARSLDVLLVLTLAVLTWRQARLYADAETLYGETLRRNPACWLCANNLGVLRLPGSPDRMDDALSLFQEAIRLNPQYAEAHNNIGSIRQQRGDLPAAIAEFRLALAAEPNYPAAHRNLGAAHYNLGLTLVSQDSAQALAHFQEAIRLNPSLAEAHNSAGNILLGLGRVGDAIGEYLEVLRLEPDFAEAHYNLGNAYLSRRDADAAMAEYREAVRLRPTFAEPHNTIGNVLRRAGRLPDAVAEYRTALRLRPGFADVHNNLGLALEALGRFDEAVAEYREALRLNPDMPEARANLDRTTRR